MLGVDIVLLTELTRRIGNQVLPLGAPWGADVVHIGGIVSSRRAGCWPPASPSWCSPASDTCFARTRLGVGMRAAAADGPPPP